MRGIKFRAWDESKNIMYQPNVVDLFIDFVGNFYSINSIGHLVPIRGLKLMQYVGITDCLGEKVFEGDICELRTGYGKYGEIGIVGFEDREFCFTNLQEGLYGEFKVIGNIHENSELIKS